jgi:hypothetical protein
MSEQGVLITSRIPPDTHMILRPNSVEYRLETSGGIRVVEVIFNTSIPRESHYAEDRTGVVKIFLDLEEILSYIEDARKRLGL